VPAPQISTAKPRNNNIPEKSTPDQKKQRPVKAPFVKSTTTHAPEKILKKEKLNTDKKDKFRDQLNDLLGTRAAAIYDRKGNFAGRVPLKELQRSIGHVSEPGSLVVDGEITKDMVRLADAPRRIHRHTDIGWHRNKRCQQIALGSSYNHGRPEVVCGACASRGNR